MIISWSLSPEDEPPPDHPEISCAASAGDNGSILSTKHAPPKSCSRTVNPHGRKLVLSLFKRRTLYPPRAGDRCVLWYGDPSPNGLAMNRFGMLLPFGPWWKMDNMRKTDSDSKGERMTTSPSS
mmetsp:Transcript_38388/g.80763  ORF Transcript_38388/g.80763 Transcript_38388/m.80763 type:complete len:124 (+) Transcript_38388:484-855(+)